MDLAKLTLTGAVDLIQGGGMKPSELTAEFLDRIDTYDHVYKTFIRVMREDAEKAARRKDSLPPSDIKRYPLHGIPLGIKDIFDVKGVPTTAGTTVHPKRNAEDDAPVVKSLRRAGAVILGKLNMHEIALGVTSMNPHFGKVRNPWNPGSIAGGSSGGSGAGLAASFFLGSLGTDTGGSIRIPASLCGIVGIKPTYGLIDKKGVTPLSWSLDHVGPMAKTVEDIALLLRLLTGKNYPLDGPERKKVRIGLHMGFFWDWLHEDVRRNMLASIRLLEKSGYSIEENLELKHASRARNILLLILLSEAGTYYNEVLNSEQKRKQLGGDILPRLEQGRMIFANHYLEAQRLRRVYIERMLRDIFSRCDVLLLPTTPVPAPEVDASEVRLRGKVLDVSTALTRCTAIFNLTGLPAVSVPNGFSREGLPTGMQLVSKPLNEGLILQAARQYELRARWHETAQPRLRSSI